MIRLFVFLTLAAQPVWITAAGLPQHDGIAKLESAMMSAAAQNGAAGYLSYYADDAVELPNGAPMLQGKVNISKGMNFLDDKNNRLTWTPVHIDVSKAGDLAYSYGTFEFRSRGKDGKPGVERGKYTTIWKRQNNGTWKVVLDMGNTMAPSEGGN